MLKALVISPDERTVDFASLVAMAKASMYEFGGSFVPIGLSLFCLELEVTV